LRRPHALHGAHRAAQIRRLSLRHIMTMNAGPISIAFEFSRRRAIALPAPRFSASVGLLPLASVSTASSSSPPDRPTARGLTFKPSCDRPPPPSQRTHRRSKAKLRPRFPHRR